ncbi:hypothetical protein [Pandoraea cepalis]|uniref:hypothetical protein n=1 Tax=Pandoraea cepalis TaxID=2508294 RepID=UPI00263B5CB3|nr:hypothetical protein [Pandoraea cepalis]
MALHQRKAMRPMNRFGLLRNIPAHVKRAVRQACGFGCVICGNPFIQYHHSDVSYADAAIHDPKKITLLCGGCHDRVSRGTYSDEKVREHIEKPYCLTRGPAFADLDYGSVAPHVRFAGSEFEDCTFPVRVHDYGLIRFEKPAEAVAPVQISAFFANTRGEISLVISRNEVLLMPHNWDATAEGTHIRIWDAAREPSLSLNLIPRQSIEIERIESLLLGWRLSGDSNSLKVTPPGAAGPSTFSGNRISGSHVGYQFGRPMLR